MNPATMLTMFVVVIVVVVVAEVNALSSLGGEWKIRRAPSISNPYISLVSLIKLVYFFDADLLAVTHLENSDN